MITASQAAQDIAGLLDAAGTYWTVRPVRDGNPASFHAVGQNGESLRIDVHDVTRTPARPGQGATRVRDDTGARPDVPAHDAHTADGPQSCPRCRLAREVGDLADPELPWRYANAAGHGLAEGDTFIYGGNLAAQPLNGPPRREALARVHRLHPTGRATLEFPGQDRGNTGPLGMFWARLAPVPAAIERPPAASRRIRRAGS